MGQTIELLENALRAWEDICLLDEARIRTDIELGDLNSACLVGPPKHWRDLRNHLLHLEGGDFDINRFCFPRDEKQYHGLFGGSENRFGMFPLQIASWVMASRRSFDLSSDLVERFLRADYSNYTWSDILWPFESFFIRFETPIKFFADTEDFASAILVSSIHRASAAYCSDDSVELGLFYTLHDGEVLPTTLMNDKERARLDKHLRHNHWLKVNNSMCRIFNTYPAGYNGKYPLPAGGSNPIGLSKSAPIYSCLSVMRVVAGLCLYLEALPPGTVENYGWKQPQRINPKRELRKVITDGEQICRVEDFNVISPDTISLFPETLRKGPAYTVTPHWRRAHYRRKKGQGHNPDAPRDVLVRSALIHKDQLPEGSVPGGAISSVR